MNKIYYIGETIQELPNVAGSQSSIDAGNNRYLINSFRQIGDYLSNSGFPGNIIPFASAQVMLETGGLKSHISKADFNLSGIKWINKPYQEATKGTKAPEGGYYAHYNSYTQWANDFKRVLSIGGDGAAIHATDLQDYVNRLYTNKYFTSAPSVYYRNLSMILQAAGSLKTQQAKQTTDAISADARAHNWWGNLPVMEKGAIIVGGFIIFVTLIKS